jgi:predicted nucleotidyltransferase
MMKSDDILSLLRVFKQNSAAKYDIKRIGIFGSFARGEAKEDSDVDIVFETDSPNLFRTARMKVELENLFSRHVDVVRFRARMNPRLKSRITREAKYV